MIELSQEKIKSIIAKEYRVSVDDVSLYLDVAWNVIKCKIEAEPRRCKDCQNYQRRISQNGKPLKSGWCYIRGVGNFHYGNQMACMNYKSTELKSFDTAKMLSTKNDFTDELRTIVKCDDFFEENKQ